MLLRLCQLRKRAAKFRMQPCRNKTLDHSSCVCARARARAPRVCLLSFSLGTNGRETNGSGDSLFGYLDIPLQLASCFYVSMLRLNRLNAHLHLHRIARRKRFLRGVNLIQHRS